MAGDGSGAFRQPSMGCAQMNMQGFSERLRSNRNQPMSHNPGAAGVGAQVVANGARGLATGTAASAEVSALVPAGADEVSAHAALAFASEGVEALALNSFAQEELSRAGAAYMEVSGIYTAVDGENASVLS